MSFINKIKDFFYDEEYEDEVEVTKEKVEPKKEKKLFKPEKNVNIYDIAKEREEIKEKSKPKKEEKKEIPERDLFRAERTFNFPIDDFDETRTDFEPVREPVKEARPEPVRAENQNNLYQTRKINPPKRSEPSRAYQNTNTNSNIFNNPYSNTYSQPSYPTYKKETKKFKPTPIISPIYGVLNENYRKEDIVDTHKTRIRLGQEEQEDTDFDKVRKKAYAKLDEELEKTMKETPKEIFYNMDDSLEEAEEKAKNIENEIKNDYEEEPYKKDEVIITYGEVEEEEENVKEATPIEPKEIPEEKKIDEEEEDEVPKITRTKRKKKEETPEEEEEPKEENDNDLYKIIDNMYNEEEEEEEE